MQVYFWDGSGSLESNSAYGFEAQAPAVGVVIKAAIWDRRLFTMFQLQDLTGRWVAMRTAICKLYLDETELCSYKHESTIAVLHDSDERVAARVALAKARLQSSDSQTRERAQSEAMARAQLDAQKERQAAAASLAQRCNNALTVTLHSDAPLSTVRDVLQHDKDAWRFRLRVSVTDVLPALAVHMCRPYCSECERLLPHADVRRREDELLAARGAKNSDAAAHAGKENAAAIENGERGADGDVPESGVVLDDDGEPVSHLALAHTQPPLEPCVACKRVPTEWRYLLAVRLRDETGALDALLVDDEASNFFYDVPPGDLRQNNCSRDALERKVSALLLPNQKIDVCVQSYVPEARAALDADESSASLTSDLAPRMYQVRRGRARQSTLCKRRTHCNRQIFDTCMQPYGRAASQAQ